MAHPFPPPNYIPTESAIDGIEVYIPAPTEENDHREVVHFKCPQCGALTAFSATDGGLTLRVYPQYEACAHCGYYEPPQQQTVVGKRAAIEYRVETLQRAAYGQADAHQELTSQSGSKMLNR